MGKIHIISFYLCLIVAINVNAQLSERNAFIVGENVRMRKNPAIKSEIVSVFKTGMALKIINTTSEREIIETGNGLCDSHGYYWYQCQSESGTEGWIFGAFVWTIPPANELPGGYDYSDAFEYQSKEYHVVLARSNTYGIADENGLTGCDQPWIPFVFDIQEQKAIPIQFIGENANHLSLTQANYLLFADNEGCLDRISGINAEQDGIKITIMRNFQDGYAELVLNLTRDDKRFFATTISYKSNY